jgi:hypothetical protein
MQPETLFITKTWGFGPERIPLTGFSTAEAQTNFERRSQRDPNTWIAILATNGSETAEEDRGRLLGAVRPSFQRIDADQVLKEAGIQLPDNEYENGIYKWPHSFPVIEAVRFVDAPHSNELFGGLLQGQEWARYAIPVLERFGREVAEKICSLPTVTAEVADFESLRRIRAQANALGGQRNGPTGPPPNEGGGGGKRTLGAGYAYALHLQGGLYGDAYKIGSTSDLDARLDTLNFELRPSVSGCQWKRVLHQQFESERYAYNFEQRLLSRLSERRVDGEKEIIRIALDELQNNWLETFKEGKWVDGLD